MKKLLSLFLIMSFVFMIPIISFAESSDISITSDGFYQFVGSHYFDNDDYSSGSPYFGSYSPPDNYFLVGYASRGDDSRNRSLSFFVYAPFGTQYLCYSFSPDGNFCINDIYNSNGSDFYILYNITSSSGSITASSVYTGLHSDFVFNEYYQFTSFLPLNDSNGNILIPDSQPQFNLNLLSLSDHLHYNVSNVSSDIGSIDYYLFPSSFPDSGGAVRNLISSPVSISEIPASVYYEIENDGFASVIDSAFDVYNSVHGLMPAVTFYSESSVSRLNRIFDFSSYSLPYVKLGTYNINGHFGSSGGGQYLDLTKIANSSSGVYAYDNLCIIAVAHKDNRDFLARLDFNVSSLRNSSVVPPSDIVDSNTYQGGVVTDLQELAMYIKYLFENSDHNLSIEFHNFTAYLQHIPWKSIVEEGVYFGLSDVIPKLQELEFDTDFDLPSLMNELSPLLQNTQLSLPDLTGALAPYFNGLDITPTGNFAGFLGNMNNNFQLHLDSLFDDINHSVTDLSTELHDSVTDLSTEINNNTTEIFVPDLDDMNDRLELSGTLLSNKFKFVDDVKDNLEDVRDTIANSSESPPDWHFTVFGVRLFLVDWSVYEPYRGTVKNIFVCIAYILLFKHIYKTIPLNGGDDS